MKTIKIIIAVKEQDLPILKKLIAEFHTGFTGQSRILKLEEKKFDGITNTICTITGFASSEMVYYFGYQMKTYIDLSM